MRNCFLILLFLELFSSCKKDKLHWQKAEQIDLPTHHRLNKLLFITDQIGFMVGGERFLNTDLLKTTDGGQTWQLTNFSNIGKALYGISIADQGKIWCTGFDGKLLTTTDTGIHWTFNQLTHWSPYNAIACFGKNAIVVGGVSFESGFRSMIDSNSNTVTWDSTNYQMNNIVALDAEMGICCGSGVLLKTRNAGLSWEFKNINSDNFTGIDAHKNGEIWICGTAGSIFYSQNSGDDWTRLRNGNDITIPHYRLHDILFINAAEGYAVGENGIVIYTNDSGKHWMELDKFTDAHLYSIVRKLNGDLFVCGENGNLWRLVQKH